MSFLATALASGNSTSTLANVEPGALGFLVVAGMGVILFFLLKNMNKQFKKLGPPPEEKGADVSDKAEKQPAAVEPRRPRAAITAGSSQPEGRVQTGDPKQDAIAEGAAKRK